MTDLSPAAVEAVLHRLYVATGEPREPGLREEERKKAREVSALRSSPYSTSSGRDCPASPS